MKHEIVKYPTLEETIKNDYLLQMAKMNGVNKSGSINDSIKTMENVIRRMEQIKQLF
jgi:hypothetical protein